MKTPDHILKDAGRHAYDRISDTIHQIYKIHDGNPDVLAVVASNGMQASFFHFYIAARLACGPITASEAMNKWTTAMQKELDYIEKAYDASEEYERLYNSNPDHKGH